MPTRMEEMAAKGMGAVKAAKATLEGLHGVFKELAKEHGEVSAMLMRVKGSTDIEKRRELFPEIRRQLLAHEKGEMRDVYPEFAKRPELERIAKEHNEEANVLERTLDDLNAIPYSDDAWKGKFDKLVELVQAHVDEEEGEFFPEGEKVLGKDEAERMLGNFEKTRQELLRQPS